MQGSNLTTKESELAGPRKRTKEFPLHKRSARMYDFNERRTAVVAKCFAAQPPRCLVDYVGERPEAKAKATVQ